MKHIADALRNVLTEVLPQLNTISEELASQKPAIDKWSRKEILGHLIDSACNNQQKLVRAISGNCSLPPYEQDAWVAAQQYQQSPWADLVKLWYAYNSHIADIIYRIPETSLAHSITIGADVYTLEFVATDYVVHLQHHIGQILAVHE